MFNVDEKEHCDLKLSQYVPNNNQNADRHPDCKIVAKEKMIVTYNNFEERMHIQISFRITYAYPNFCSRTLAAESQFCTLFHTLYGHTSFVIILKVLAKLKKSKIIIVRIIIPQHLNAWHKKCVIRLNRS